MPGERFFDVESLEFSNGFVQQDLAVQHFFNQGFKFGAHLHRNGLATDYLLKSEDPPHVLEISSSNELVGFEVATGGCLGYVRGYRWGGWLLIPTESLEIVSHELLIE